ncbi:serine/threonine protein kinase [Streptomyces agglomeratus]|uniref:serine/threonine-protein kinase n=1 Tax=Streptomyces agglomeratus TaxID=285458 RepID=UPI0008525158|nr:serine/threonine-protein kinase [Streptomyces agglomeratus]OEJ37288.1 serine/threonine protein kinase [Streptomyces agglomeratus]OEJ48331.1 serine/threonine protein kinase [Streptomyces agglomeratus]
MEPLQSDDPRELGTYRLLARLGAGGMGRVYLARSPGGRTVAVKVVRQDLATDQAFRQRFRHEVDIARAVSGRYTAPVVDAAPDAPLPWLATAYVLGPDLTDVVASHGALPEPTVRALGAGLAAALQEIHAAGLIHRDLKPSNVLLAADGPRVIDFGIARAVDGSRMTQTGVVVGSPGYMPPEQALGRDVGTAGDVFSLGAVLAFAATGRSAFGDLAPAAMLYQVVHEEPDLAGVPPMLTGLIRACLAKNPAARPSPAEILQSLAPGGTGEVLADWLPSAVSSTIATHASRILDLDTPAQGTTPAAYGPPPTVLDASSRNHPAQQPTSTQAAAAPQAPATPQAPTSTGFPAPSRRRFLGLAAGGVAGVAVAGTGGTWWLTRDGSKKKPKADGKDGEATNNAEPEVFKTPPNGVAPQPLWHNQAASLSRNYDVPPRVFGDSFLVLGDTTAAYDVRTGKRKWARKEISGPADTLTVSGNTLFLPGPDYDGTVIGYDIRTGKESWRTRLGGRMDGEVQVAAVDDKRVYVVAVLTDDDIDKRLNAIAAIDIRTREIVWQEQRDEGTQDDIALTVGDGHLIYTHGAIDDDLKNLTVRDARTGTQRWNRRIADDEVQPTIFGGMVFLGGENLLRAVDLKTGRDVWKLSPNGRRGFHRPSVLRGVLYVMDYDRGVWAIEPKTSKKIWMSEELGSREFGEWMVRTDDSLYIASYFEQGGVYALSAKDGSYRWNYNDGVKDDGEWQITEAGSRLLVSHADHLYTLPAV